MGVAWDHVLGHPFPFTCLPLPAEVFLKLGVLVASQFTLHAPESGYKYTHITPRHHLRVVSVTQIHKSDHPKFHPPPPPPKNGFHHHHGGDDISSPPPLPRHCNHRHGSTGRRQQRALVRLEADPLRKLHQQHLRDPAGELLRSDQGSRADGAALPLQPLQHSRPPRFLRDQCHPGRSSHHALWHQRRYQLLQQSYARWGRFPCSQRHSTATAR
ncbi:unnamed protein product [Linum tenue]|uniref:Uncharacterized protein n=1 Tax=Linum tenue TaxID=586396 RepID=A0AAV0QA75_9ROSI|nr:unnamed protein product [Linum tenue]